MKLLVLSDSHGAKDELNMVINSRKYDYVIFLGDYVSDILSLQTSLKDKLILVRGNCDSLHTNINTTAYIKVHNVKIMAVHGHEYDVKSDLCEKLSLQAKKYGVDLVLYGHTHIDNDKVINGVRCINPGSFGRKKGKTNECCYAVIDINENNEIDCKFFKPEI